MSLFKIPLILSSAAVWQKSFTTPNHSSSDEVVNSPLSERIMFQMLKCGLPFIKGLYWGVSILEIAVIASRAAGLSTLPSMIQHVAGSRLGRIQDTPITFPFLFGTALIVGGGLIRWWCFCTLGRFFTFQVSLRKDHQLVKTGPYAIVRHPSYTGALLQFLGVLILHGSRTSWIRDSGVLETITGLKLAVLVWLGEIIMATLSMLLRTSQEEEVVKLHFENEWEVWAELVRYRLIPGIY